MENIRELSIVSIQMTCHLMDMLAVEQSTSRLTLGSALVATLLISLYDEAEATGGTHSAHGVQSTGDDEGRRMSFMPQHSHAISLNILLNFKADMLQRAAILHSILAAPCTTGQHKQRNMLVVLVPRNELPP